MNAASFKNTCRLGIFLLVFSVAFGSAVFAQDSKPVISSSSAEALKEQVDYSGEPIEVDALAFKQPRIVALAPKIDAPSNFSKDDSVPALQVESRTNSKLSLGVLQNGTDTADGITRRDPYAVENVEVDPIYPEGIYVDELRASAGVGVVSKF